MRLHPTFRPFNAFMVFNCNWQVFYYRTLPNLCFFFAKFALVSTNLCQTSTNLCQIPLKKGFLFAKRGFYCNWWGFYCNWQVFYYRTLPNLCFFFAKFALVSTNLCQTSTNLCQIPLKKGFLFAKRGFYCNWWGFYCNWLVFYFFKHDFTKQKSTWGRLPWVLLRRSQTGISEG